ncbi:hypothetical protein FSF50_011605 [Escherichia coli]|nr:hypothetical protein [Escherichia coli]EFB2786794.1 hypothetical protein [Escherichia coli]EJH6424760.1 hypothetical protein [Escherichia coli]ELN5918479.1 hypothetical protein [Escherichia coli]MBB7400357.1 hypothetical protein [Escherichia coli]
MDIIKSLIPFTTFLLGIILAPYVESRKEKEKIKTLKKSIFTELEDELSILEKSIKTTSKSIKERTFKPKDFQYISLGKTFEPIILEKNIDNIYPYYNRDTRIALKNVLLLSKQIKSKYDYVSENWKVDNYSCKAKEESMLFSMLSVYYVINKILQERERFILANIPNEKIVEIAANALQVPVPFKAP